MNNLRVLHSTTPKPVKIILLRHGASSVGYSGKLKASELHQWIDAYNAAGIDHKSQPSAETIDMAKACGAVVCSDLCRSVASAERLGVSITHSDPLLREVALPYGEWHTPNASPLFWAALFRLLWFCGYSSHGESISLAKKRAMQAADKLENIAKNSGSVLHVGHGFMNRYISKALIANGWSGPNNPGRKHWGFGIYTI